MNWRKFLNSISVWLFIQCVNVILNLLIFKLKDKRKSACNNKWCDNFSYFAWSKQVKYVQLKFIILKTQWIVYEAICWVKCFIELDIKRTVGDRMVTVTNIKPYDFSCFYFTEVWMVKSRNRSPTQTPLKCSSVKSRAPWTKMISGKCLRNLEQFINWMFSVTKPQARAKVGKSQLYRTNHS